MQQYGDSWAQHSAPYSPASQQQQHHYHASVPASGNSSSGSSSSRKKDKDKDRSDKSSRRDKSSADGSKHSKRNSSSAHNNNNTQPSNGNNSNSNNANNSNNINNTYNLTSSTSTYSSPPSPTTPPSPPSPPLPPSRVDLHSRHQALNTLLSSTGGESRVAAYWSVIELFLRAQLSKAELDVDVRKLVGESSIHIHNDFFFALLQNAMSDELPNAATAAAATKTKREGDSSSGGSANKAEKGDKVKREGAEVVGKEGQKVEGKEGGKEGKKDKDRLKDGKRDKSTTPLPLTPTAASAASSSAVSVKAEDKREGKKRKDGTVKAEKEGGKRDKRKDRHDEDETVDWTEQVWPSPPPPQRWSEVSQASVHREMKHITSASDYFAALRRERERRGVVRDGDSEEGGKEGSEWLWAIEESKVGYLRVRSAEEQADTSRASVQHAVSLIRSRARSKKSSVGDGDERMAGKDEERADGGSMDGASIGGDDRPAPAWLNPASSAAYRTSPLSLPALSAMRARCLLIAKHGGLKSISESALSLIHHAMCQYVRTLLAEMVADRAVPIDLPSAATVALHPSEQDEQRSGAAMMEVDGAASSSPSPTTASASSPSSFSSFPASCFAPSLFTPLSANPNNDTLVKAETSDSAPSDDAASLMRQGSSAVVTAASAEGGIAASSTVAAADAPSTDTSSKVKMETESSVAPTQSVDADVSMTASDTNTTASYSALPTPTAPIRSLSVSVPTSPPSLVPSVASPSAPSLSLTARSSKAEEEEKVRNREAEDDVRMPFPFLIARQPAYCPPLPALSAPSHPPAAASLSTARSVPRVSGVATSLSSPGALSLADLLHCLRDRSSVAMRVGDDLPMLLERLIIVQ